MPAPDPIDRRPRRRLLREERGDAGNLLIGVGVSIIVLLLTLTVLTRVLSSTASARQSQDFGAALSTADAGLTDALYVIGSGATTDFRTTEVTSDGTWEIAATRVGDNEWEVWSRGQVNGVPHAIYAEIVRGSDFPYAMWGEDLLDFNGLCESGGVNRVRSYNSETGAAAPTGRANVGSDGRIESNPSDARSCGDAHHIFAGGACNSVKCEPQDGEAPDFDPPAEPDASLRLACPIDPLTGYISTSLTGSALTYYCAQDIEFDPSTWTQVTQGTGGHPVTIFVADGYGVSFADARVNLDPTYDPLSGNNPPQRAMDLRVLVAGENCGTNYNNSRVQWGNGAAAGQVNGIVYAPGHDVKIPGGKALVASLTGCRVRVDGDPNLNVLYDEAISAISTQDWQIVNWTEVGSSRFPEAPTSTSAP